MRNANKISIRYGQHRHQVGDLWRPDDASGPLPTVVLIHGGFWRSVFTRQLMNRLAVAVTQRGWAAWNIEYRCLGLGGGGGGWPGTFDDVAAAVEQLVSIEAADKESIVVCGHSAGGHLALWVSGRERLPAGSPGTPQRIAVKGVVSLAGIADLEKGAQLGLGNGVIERLCGGESGGPGDEGTSPVAYRWGSPAAMIPLGIPQVLIHGLDDTVVPASMSQEYCVLATAAGDDALYVPLEGIGHREMIDPDKSPWLITSQHLERLLS